MAIQVQILILITEGAIVGVEGVIERSNTETNIEITKPLVFNRKAGKVGGFITVYRLYLRIKIRWAMVEKQIQ